MKKTIHTFFSQAELLKKNFSICFLLCLLGLSQTVVLIFVNNRKIQFILLCFYSFISEQGQCWTVLLEIKFKLYLNKCGIVKSFIGFHFPTCKINPFNSEVFELEWGWVRISGFYSVSQNIH